MADVLALLVYWRIACLAVAAQEPAGAALLVRLRDAVLGACLGLPLATLFPFLGMLRAGLPLPSWLPLVELPVAAACCFVLERRIGILSGGVRRTGPEAPLGRSRMVLLGCACAVAGALLLTQVWSNPTGGHDALAMWNQRARIFLRGSGPWPLVLEGLRDTPNANYPLGWSLAVARIGSASGCEEPAAAVAANLVYLCGCLAALVRARGQGWAPAPFFAAACVLAGTQDFVALAADLYVDIPIAFFLLYCIGSALEPRGAAREEPAALVAPALCLGGAAWFKAEGTLHLLVGLALLVWLVAARQRARALAILGGVALPFFAARVAWHLLAATPNEYVSIERIPEFLGNVGSAGRWLAVLEHMHVDLLSYGFGALPVLLAAGLVLRWFDGPPSADRPRAAAGSALLAIWVVYLTILAGSPYPDVHIVLGQTSTRLLTQLYPSILALWAASVDRDR